MASHTHILGIATAFPTNLTKPQDLENFAKKWCDESDALEKTLLINRHTKILQRPMIQTTASPLINGKQPPTIKAVNKLFMDKGVELAVKAAKGAIEDWGGSVDEITHLVCNTCTASSYPGFDHAIMMALQLPMSTDRTLLHGVGCAGGLAAIRLARQLSLVPPTDPSRPPRILVVATEITSTLCRSEIDEMSKAGDEGRANVSLCLFSDGASGIVIGGGELREGEHSSFEVLDSVTETVPETAADLAFNVDEYGWKAIISSRVPLLTSKAVPPIFSRLLASPRLSTLSESTSFLTTPPPSTPPSSFDWLIHPGGSLILSKLEAVLGITAADHTKSSWNVYKNKGNTSSVSIGAVIEHSRNEGDREGCVVVAFGPGVTVEMSLFRRTGWKGRALEGAANGNGVKSNGHLNGHAVDVKKKINGVTDGVSVMQVEDRSPFTTVDVLS